MAELAIYQKGKIENEIQKQKIHFSNFALV